MSYSQKYCLVSFDSPVEIGAVFEMSDWPLHVTLADVFAIDRDSSDMDTQLSELLATQSRVTTHATKDAILGETKVVLLEKCNDLLSLHNAIVNLLESDGAVFNTPEFTREGFLPHCTVQKAGHLNEGDEVRIDSVTLVDMFPDGDWRQRKVLANFTLG